MIDIKPFIAEQLARWPMAAANHAALASVASRPVDGVPGVRLQYNPARIVSTGAKVDAEALKARPCFLCEANRPPEQIGLPWGRYTILINPYPIFEGHLTIPANDHTPQLIAGRVGDMMRLGAELPGYTIFYNGAKCGASAPDHMHFQGVPTAALPLWQTVPAQSGDANVIGGIKAHVIHYSDIAEAETAFGRYMATLPVDECGEPMVNILCREGTLVVIPRRSHRPDNYGHGDGQVLVSPASIDLSGVIITPLEKDYKNLDATGVTQILRRVCY